MKKREYCYISKLQESTNIICFIIDYCNHSNLTLFQIDIQRRKYLPFCVTKNLSYIISFSCEQYILVFHPYLKSNKMYV